MKRLFFVLTLVLATFVHGAAQDAMEQANQCYINGNYADAANCYEQLLAELPLTRQSRAEVLYNLGNARFKQGELAQAILAYERSLRLNPSDKDTQYNLEFARTQIVDNIEDNRAFFFSSWAKSVRNLLAEPVWRWMSIVCFFLMLVGALLFALGRTTLLRKSAFHVAWIMLLVALVSGLNASSLHKRDTLQPEAIITQGVLTAKSSPDQSGTDLFTLHEGTKVEIQETLGDWCNIRVANNEGWILLSYLERI